MNSKESRSGYIVPLRGSLRALAAGKVLNLDKTHGSYYTFHHETALQNDLLGECPNRLKSDFLSIRRNSQKSF